MAIIETRSAKTVSSLPVRTPPSPARSLEACDPRADQMPWEQDSYSSRAVMETVDRSMHASLARLTGGLSPATMAAAYADWWVHLASSPGKQAQLAEKAVKKAMRLSRYAASAVSGAREPPCIAPLPQDRRFEGAAWRTQPFDLMRQSFLMTQQWWHNATTDVNGVSAAHERMVEFGARQILDVVSPTNCLWTNPEAIDATLAQGGANFRRGWRNFLDDLDRTLRRAPSAGAENFVPGETVAVTPGKVVYRNHLIELIRYAPQTDKVFAEPVLIIPAWIMKYYVLDLSPENSLVRYLVEQGHTVFMISWRNPGPEDRDLGMDDYLKQGALAALDATAGLTGSKDIHAVGYCLGGTLLSILAAYLAREGDERLKTLTFLAAQMDFTEAGELSLFTNESQIAFLENLMWEQGYLDATQMAGAFTMLRSSDLLWSRIERSYLMGERRPINDLMAWNADSTRMPYRMHSEYLRRLFLQNQLAAGRYAVDGDPVVLSDVTLPVFAVGTERDHVAPWRSVFKTHLLMTHADVTFLLTSGGHNAGIVSEPSRTDRHYRVRLIQRNDPYMDPERWLDDTPVNTGAWWPEWRNWLARHSTDRIEPPPFRFLDHEMRPSAVPPEAMADAPGRYVLMS